MFSHNKRIKFRSNLNLSPCQKTLTNSPHNMAQTSLGFTSSPIFRPIETTKNHRFSKSKFSPIEDHVSHSREVQLKQNTSELPQKIKLKAMNFSVAINKIKVKLFEFKINLFNRNSRQM